MGRLSISILLVVIIMTSSIITGCGIFGPPPSQIRVNEGNEFYEQGCLEEAIDKYTEAIRIEPTWEEPYYLRGIAYCDLSKYELGIEDFNEAIRLAHLCDEAYYNRGLAYAELGRKAEAIADFEKLISFTDDSEFAEEAREELEELSE